MRGNGGSSGRRKGGVSESALAVRSRPRGRSARPLPPAGIFPARSPNTQSGLNISALTSGRAKRAGSFPGRPPVGALSAQMRGPSPRPQCPVRHETLPMSPMRKYRSFAEDLPNRPSTRGTRSRVGPVTGGVRLKAAVSATGRMRQKRTFWVNSSTVSRTPKEFSIEAGSGLLNCDRRKNSSFSTVSVESKCGAVTLG